MNTKEAIDFCNSIHGDSADEGYKEEVISLLQQGEKYKQMWEELDTMYITGIIPEIPNEECGFLYGVQKYILKTIKQKYFPKEVNK